VNGSDLPRTEPLPRGNTFSSTVQSFNSREPTQSDSALLLRLHIWAAMVQD